MDKKYKRILKLLEYEDMRLIDIAKEVNVSIDVVKKVSQVRNVRNKFIDMNLDASELEFLESIWTNILYLRNIDSEEEIRAVIKLLKSIEPDDINKDEIHIAVACLTARKSEILEVENSIKVNKSRLLEFGSRTEYNSYYIEEKKAIIDKVESILEKYEECDRGYLYDLLAFYGKEFKYYDLVLKYHIDGEHYFKLKKANVLCYMPTGRCCRVDNIEKLFDYVLKNKIEFKHLARKGLKNLYEAYYEGVSEEEHRVADAKVRAKQAEGALKYCEDILRRLEDEYDLSLVYGKVKKKYNEYLCYMKASFCMDYGDSSVFYECSKSARVKAKKNNEIYIDNFFDINNKNFLVSEDGDLVAYVIFNEYCKNSAVDMFQHVYDSLIEHRANYIIRKLKKNIDKVYFVGYSSYEGILAYEGRLSNTARELTEFNICRTLNQRYLFD